MDGTSGGAGTDGGGDAPSSDDGGTDGPSDDGTDGGDADISSADGDGDVDGNDGPTPRLLGTPETDAGSAIAVDDAGDLFLAGTTEGDLGGETNSGRTDGFVAKFDPSGTLGWVELLGTPTDDEASGVAVDGSGNIYVAGETTGNLGGETNSGGTDAFVAKYDGLGNRRRIDLFGTSKAERAHGVVADGSGTVYVAGETTGELGGETNSGGPDGFVATYDASGNRQWVELVGTADRDRAYGVAHDGSGNVYATGKSTGGLGAKGNGGAKSMFVVKYGASGHRQWVDSLEADAGIDVAVGRAQDVYVTGQQITGRSCAKDFDDYCSDVLVARYDIAGHREWSETLGISDQDSVTGIAVDGSGNIYMSGATVDGVGQTFVDTFDAFVAKYSDSGNREWVESFGSSRPDVATGVAVDGLGTLHVAGWTEGDLGGKLNRGDRDAYTAVVE